MKRRHTVQSSLSHGSKAHAVSTTIVVTYAHAKKAPRSGLDLGAQHFIL